MKSENLKIQYQKGRNILRNLLKYYERSERILSNGSSIGGMFYAGFLDRNFINLGRNKLKPMTS